MKLQLLLAANPLNTNPGIGLLVVPLILFLCSAVALVGSMILISKLSGWSLLARRFRASEPWTGELWSWQSARFRGWCGYNNCLRVGANPQWLSLSVIMPFGFFHSPLQIPWREIEVETGKACFGLYDTAQFRIGTEERVTVRIYGKLVDRVREAAGSSWPLYHQEQIASQLKS
jgi:hypothetical protein